MYKKYTIQELINTLKNVQVSEKEQYITLGDFEGNYIHEKFEPLIDEDGNIFLGYEQHEGETKNE